MNLARTLGRGMRFGAQVGMVLAIGAMLATGSVAGLGFATEALGLPPLAGGFGAAAEAISGIVVGAIVGGSVFTATHAVTHAIPGLPRLLGDAPPKEPTRRAGQAPSKARGAEPARQQPVRLAEADDRNTGFRRQVEEQRMRDEMLDQGIGR